MACLRIKNRKGRRNGGMERLEMFETLGKTKCAIIYKFVEIGLKIDQRVGRH